MKINLDDLDICFNRWFSVGGITVGSMTMEDAEEGFDIFGFINSVGLLVIFTMLYHKFGDLTWWIVASFPVMAWLSVILHEMGHYIIARKNEFIISHGHVSTMFYTMLYVPDEKVLGFVPWSQEDLLTGNGAITVNGYKPYPPDEEYTEEVAEIATNVIRGKLAKVLMAGPSVNLVLSCISIGLHSILGVGILSALLLAFGIVNVVLFFLSILGNDGRGCVSVWRNPKRHIKFNIKKDEPL